MICNELFTENLRGRIGFASKPGCQVARRQLPPRCADTNLLATVSKKLALALRSSLESADESPMLMKEAAII